MFCPKCKVEYEDWVKECADCGVPLVKELPQEPKQRCGKEKDLIYKEVLSTYNQGDVAIIKAVLDSGNITYFLKGEYFSYMRTLVEPVVLMVREDQVEKAIELLRNYKLEYRGIITDRDKE